MDKLNVCFVTQGGIHLASHRMRITKPSELLNVGTRGLINAYFKPKADAEAGVNVFSKHFDVKGNYLAAKSGPDLGYYSILDICDDHFDREHTKYYEGMCEAVDSITCNSKNMQERIYEVTGKLARIIPDPITFPKGEFKPYTEELKLLWYGHSSNIEPLMNWLPFLNGLKVTVVSDTLVQHPQIISHKWKSMVVEKLIKDHDIVLLPTTKHPWTKCKSPNRAVDAIYSGKLVITDSPEVYGDLSEFIVTVESPLELPTILGNVISNQAETKKMIEKGQKFVERTYSDSKIIDGWLATFKDLGLLKSVAA